MYRKLLMAAVFATGAATAASALPAAKTDMSAPSLVEKTASWRYHEKCAWRGGRWIVDLRGREVVCRPVRPRGAWVWHREGNREGWYDSRRKSWHHNNW